MRMGGSWNDKRDKKKGFHLFPLFCFDCSWIYYGIPSDLDGRGNL